MASIQRPKTELKIIALSLTEDLEHSNKKIKMLVSESNTLKK
jgi:hypothetical protein